MFALLLRSIGSVIGFQNHGRLHSLIVGAVSPDDRYISLCSGGVGRVEPIASDVVDCENNVLVKFLVHRQFTGLSEGTIAPLKVTLERLLLRVDVGVLFQVLRQCERLEAEHADMLFDR